MERSAVAGVLEEQDFALAEAEDATEVSVIGKLLGVDGVIVGEVIAYEISSSYVSIGANLRLVDVQSARVVYSDSITRHHQGNVSETRQSTVLNELSQMLAAEFVRQIAPHYIERRKYLLSTGGDASQANDRGMKFATNGLWDKAEEQFNQAKWIDPGSAAVLNNLAIVYEQSGRLNEAVEAYEAAIKLDPDKDAIQKNYATLRRTFRDHDTTPKRALEDQRSNSAEPRGPVESEESEDSASPRESEDAVIPVVPGVPGNSGNPGRPNQGAKR
jgi:tetratricopeptide (TPR) repeat protein